MWHIEPKNDTWREVHLAHVESLGNRLWLRCILPYGALYRPPRQNRSASVVSIPFGSGQQCALVLAAVTRLFLIFLIPNRTKFGEPNA
jgi:hypothetical protein